MHDSDVKKADSFDKCMKSNADFCYNGQDYVPNKKHDNNECTVYSGSPKHPGTCLERKHDNDKGVYACNVAKDTDEFCKRNLDKNSNPNSEKHHISHITVGYGDVSSYYGKGKVVIKNEDTGKTLVTHDLNFAKQHASQGDNCCVKTYAFDRVGTNTHKGDTILAKVTGGGGSWESGAYKWKANLHMSVDLDEIGQ